MLRDEYVEANGVRLHYVTEGQGPLILFLHGFPEFWYAWKEQLAEFGRDHRVAALDMRGFNLSGKPREVSEYRVEKVVEDVRAFAAHVARGEPVVLVGHDWGGYVTWAFAAAYPKLLRKLVIINAPHPAIMAHLLSSDRDQQKASEYMNMFRSDQAEQILCADEFDFLANRIMAFGKTNGLPVEDKPEYIKAWSQNGAITGGLNYYRANDLAAAKNGSAESSFVVNVPTLVIWGMLDPSMVPKNLDGLEKYVPQLTIRRISDASHWLVHTHSAEVNRHIRDFLC
jgi:epoxide hydrolase 4